MIEHKAPIAGAGESSTQKTFSEIKVNILLNNIESMKFGHWRNSSNNNVWNLDCEEIQVTIMCLVWWKLIYKKYFPYLQAFGATRNAGQPKIVFMLIVK